MAGIFRAPAIDFPVTPGAEAISRSSWHASPEARVQNCRYGIIIVCLMKARQSLAGSRATSRCMPAVSWQSGRAPQWLRLPHAGCAHMPAP